MMTIEDNQRCRGYSCVDDVVNSLKHVVIEGALVGVIFLSIIYEKGYVMF